MFAHFCLQLYYQTIFANLNFPISLEINFNKYVALAGMHPAGSNNSHNSTVDRGRVSAWKVQRKFNFHSLASLFSSFTNNKFGAHTEFIDELELLCQAKQPIEATTEPSWSGKRKLSLKVWYTFYLNAIQRRKLQRKHNLMAYFFSVLLLCPHDDRRPPYHSRAESGAISKCEMRLLNKYL